MIVRFLATTLRQRLRESPAVGLLGPRQAGKTTLALELAKEFESRAIYLDLELPSDRAKLDDPELYLSEHEGHLVVLDEIQRAPEIFQVLRSLIDQRRREGNRAGQFLVLGSASVELLKQTSESLVGRISYLELTPFLAPEIRNIDDQAEQRLWVRGGFPESFLAGTEHESLSWRTDFIRTYLERDVPTLGPRVPSETLRRLWQMLAHNQGQQLNASRLASGLGMSGQTVSRYVDILTELLLVRRLQPWVTNAGKRLVRAPKVYVRDTGLVHALLNIGDMEQLAGHPVIGPSWEGFVIENILALAPAGMTGWFYRTSAGAEIDLLLEQGGRIEWAVEVKRSLSSPQPSKGFHLACEDVGAKRRVVVYPGTERLPLHGGVMALPLSQLIKDLAGASRKH